MVECVSVVWWVGERIDKYVWIGKKGGESVEWGKWYFQKSDSFLLLDNNNTTTIF